MELGIQDGPMKIYVGGLTEHLADITENDIRNIFSLGDIDYIDLPRDPMTGKCRGYAFIQFRRASQARATIAAMNGFNYKGKILKVYLCVNYF
jgi:RNA-binding protein 39